MPSAEEEEMRSLIECLGNSKAFIIGEFKLKSGQLSPIYIDLRGLISIPSVLKQSIGAMWNKILSDQVGYDCICGVPYAALPLAAGICLDNDIPMLMRRKEAKEHGTKKLVEGRFLPGQKCLIVEDVVTEGASIIETTEILRSHGLIVEDAIVLMHRQQGADSNLLSAGIKLHSVLTLDDVLNFLVQRGDITTEKATDIKTVLGCGSFKDGTPISDSISWGLESRTAEAVHPKMKQLLELVKIKQTNLCVAADLTSAEEVLQFAAKIGSEICILKIHSDIIEEFSKKFIVQLRKLADDLKFLLLEDRKYSDTGNTVDSQFRGGVFKVSQWADIVTVHSISGPGVIQGLRNGCEESGTGLILVAEMSSRGTMTALPNYTAETVKIGQDNRDMVCGFICQKRCVSDPRFLFLTPGVHLKQKNDILDQQFRVPREAVIRDLNDIIIVGRGVYEAEDPLSETKNYKQEAFSALMERN